MNEKELEEDMHDFYLVQGEAAALRRRKLDLYGKCYDTFGGLGVAIRLKDKISRIINLYQRKIDNQNLYDEFSDNESIRDNLLDIANYAIMGVMVLDQELKEMKK